MGRLDHMVALVTGGASGLGRAIARRLSSDGATVVISDVDTSHGASTARENDLLFLEQDVRDETQWARIIQQIENEFGQLNVLVNNAGILGPMNEAGLDNTKLVDWQKIFAVNVEGVFLGCQTALPVMRRAGGGSIINISSVAGLLATPYAVAYGASKAAVRQLTKSVAQHCAEEKFNIRCNSVHPGDVRTPLWDSGAKEIARARGISVEAVIAQAESNVPLGSFTLTEDVAAAVSFLASEDARHITGAKVVVDGGLVNCDTYHMRLDCSGDRPLPASRSES